MNKEYLDLALASMTQPVLVSIGASWCTHSGSLRETLRTLVGEGSDALRVIMLNIEQDLDTRRRYEVERIPTTILLRDGKESGRLVGRRSAAQLYEWLRECGIEFPARAADENLTGHAWGAFYGDPQLRDFLFGRAVVHAKAGRLQIERFPAWRNGKGTISAALIHSADSDIFERVTGMPYAFACAMEFLRLTESAHIEALGRALWPGKNLDTIPLQLIGAWLSDEAIEWPAFLQSPEVDGLRRQWQHIFAEHLNGKKVANAHWQALRARLSVPCAWDDSTRVVPVHLARLLKCLSPPPSPRAAPEWVYIFCALGTYLLISHARFRHGWLHKDFAREMELLQWFEVRQSRQPGGQFTPESLASAQAEWSLLPKDEDYEAKEQYSHAHLPEMCEPVLAWLRDRLIGHLAGDSIRASR